MEYLFGNIHQPQSLTKFTIWYHKQKQITILFINYERHCEIL